MYEKITGFKYFITLQWTYLTSLLGQIIPFLKFNCLDCYQKYIYPKIQQVDSAGLRLTNTGQNDHGKIWRDAVSSQLEHK